MVTKEKDFKKVRVKVIFVVSGRIKQKILCCWTGYLSIVHLPIAYDHYSCKDSMCFVSSEPVINKLTQFDYKEYLHSR